MKHTKNTIYIMALIGALFSSSSWAGQADVLDVRVTPSGDGAYRFDVTLKHADTGWDHYADAFEVLAPDGTVLGTRILAHPHVNEQPFTRSLDGVRILDGVTQVQVRGRDKIHGLGGVSADVKLPLR